MAQSPSRQPSAPGFSPPGRITTPAGSTIEAVEGGYRVCDAQSHCLRTPSLWEAQQLVQWSEVHHRPLGEEHDDGILRG